MAAWQLLQRAPLPNKRSKTRRGLISLATGVLPRATKCWMNRRSYIPNRNCRPAAALDAEFKRRKRVVADILGRQLINRNAGLNVGAIGFARMHARQPCRARTRVIAAAIAQSERCFAPTRRDAEIVFDIFQRLQNLRQLESAFAGGSPIGHVHAVGHENEKHARWAESAAAVVAAWARARWGTMPSSTGGRWRFRRRAKKCVVKVVYTFVCSVTLAACGMGRCGQSIIRPKSGNPVGHVFSNVIHHALVVASRPRPNA